MFYCHLWPLRRYSVIFTLSYERHDFPGKKILYKFCTNHFSLYEQLSKILSQMFIGFSCKIDCLILTKLEISQKVFEKFHENPSSGSQVVLCGQIDGHTRRG